MSDQVRFSVELDVSTGRERALARPRSDDPFVVVVAGDFRGRTSRPGEGARPGTRPVDRDDLDDAIAYMAPRLSLELEDGSRVELTFRSLEDFHADALLDRAPFFRALREARLRLADARTFSGTLESILGGAAQRPPAATGPDADDVIADVITGSLLDRMADAQSGTPSHGDPLRGYLRRVVTPHLVPGEDPRQEALLAEVDRSIAAGLRAVLHHPDFQRLESLWRGVDFLVRRIETGPSLKIMLLDATTDELRAGLPTLPAAASVLVIDHAFGAAREDVALLRAIAAACAERGVPLLAGASPTLVGIQSFATMPESEDVKEWQDDEWHAFRRSGDAAFAGLALPRFLLREPYGREGEPCERLNFEELTTPPEHEHYLWGNAAFGCALVLAESFASDGWDLRPGSHLDITNLPLHTWRGESGPEIKPCAETLMSDRLAGMLMEAGIMVLATIRHGDTARLVRFQSAASPLRALQGPWTR